MSRVMIVTNDFPPRQGGIETFLATIAGGMPADRLVVYASRAGRHTSGERGDAAQQRFDAAQPYRIVRDPTTVLVPSPAVRRRVVDAFTAHGCDRVLFGAAAPLGLLGRVVAGRRRPPGRRDDPRARTVVGPVPGARAAAAAHRGRTATR